MTTVKKLARAKLNKRQIKEFSDSGISLEYANLNFINITKATAAKLLQASTRAATSTAVNGGWATADLSTFKPLLPRRLQGKVVKYESLAEASLSEVQHPEGTEINESYVYCVEGWKKAVAVAQTTKCRTYCFSGLTIGIKIVDQMNAIEGTKRLILDNDNTITAINVARSLVSKLAQDFQIAVFKGFKGIDDAIANGLDFSKIKFVKCYAWSASIAGYIDAKHYVFDNPQFEEVFIPELVRLIILQAGKGLGKTWLMQKLAEQKIKENCNVFVLTHRINLSRANARRLGISYIEDEGYKGGSVGFVIDSIAKININDFTGATLFIDEFTQVLDHLHNSDTLRKNRSTVYKKFIEIINHIVETNGQIVVADADADNKSVSLLKNLGGISDDQTFLIHNTHVFNKGNVYYTDGIERQFKSRIGKRKTAVNVAAKIALEAKAGKRLFVCLGSQKPNSKWSTQVIEMFLITNGVSSSDIIRIDSETIGDPSHPAYKAVDRINEICETYRIILASPTLNTGVDIQYKGFDLVACISYGKSLDSNGVRQFLSRVRDWDVPRLIFAPEKRLVEQSVSTSTKNDFEQLKMAQEETLKQVDEKWYNEMNSENRDKIYAASIDFLKSQAWENQADCCDYAKRINQGLTSEGFNVIEYESEIDFTEAEEVYQQLKSISDELSNTRKLLVQSNEVQDEEIAKKLYEASFNTLEERCGLMGYEIRRQLNLSPTPEVQTALDQGKRSELENQFAALDGYEISKQLWEKEQYWRGDRKDTKEVASDFLKRSVRPLRIKALHKINFFQTIQQELRSDDAAKLLESLKSDKLNLKLFPMLAKESKYPIKLLGSIAGLFNFELKQVKQVKGGDRFYKAIDKGFILSDTLDGIEQDVKPKVFDFWLEKRKKQADDWQAFKADIRKVKLGESLDKARHLPPLSTDFKYARLGTRAKTMPLPTMPDYRMVCAANADEFKQWLSKQAESAVDIETYGDGKKGGLNHITGSIRLIQFATVDAVWIVERSYFNLVRDSIKSFLVNPNQRKIGHNFMFDLRFLRKEFKVLAPNCADTMLGSRCLLGDLGAAQITSHSLQQACENFLGIEIDKTEQKSDWGGKLTNEQITYAAKDPWLTFILYKRLEALTKQPSLILLPFPEMMAYEAWEVENRFLFAAQQMEDTGYQIDIDLLTKTKAKYQLVRDELMSKWNAPYLPTQKGKLQQFLNKKYSLSLKSLDKATAAENSEIPEIKLMQQICACNAILVTLNKIDEQVKILGRVKPIITIASGTGRTAQGVKGIAKYLINLQALATRVNPALEDLKLPKLKALFKTNLIIDLPASHGRIAAEISNDDNHLEGYLVKGKDMHCVTAEAVAAAVFPDKEYKAEWIKANKDNDSIAEGLRSTAKNTYYAWVNGAAAPRVQAQISANLQMKADMSVCQRALDNFNNTFARTNEFMLEKQKELETNTFVINGKICGWYEFSGTYLCWVLGIVGGDLKTPVTKLKAGMWSRLEALLMKSACSRIAEKFYEMVSWKSRLQNMIHDEINAETHSEEAAKFAYEVVKEEFGKICHRTVVNFDPIEKCYPLNNWSDKT